MAQSLTTFFGKADPVTLDDCDREQIHLSGEIQNIGALLVVDPVTSKVIGASENAAMFLGVDPDRLLTVFLADVCGDLAEQVVAAGGENQILHEVLDFALEHDGIQFDTVTHLHAGRRVIEFVPNLSPSANSVRSKMRQCSRASASIVRARDFDQALEIAVAALRQISGYSRVKIYQFQDDWSGEVIAESLDGTLPSYMGLCFPAGDIPKQVREILSIVPYRAIGTVSDDVVPIHAADGVDGTLDLTWSLLRSVSRMHTAYSRNMGVEATFSCSLMHQGALWGLISAHNDRPGVIPFDSWSLLQEIGMALMLRYDQQQRTDTADMISELRRIETRFASVLRESGEVEDTLLKLAPELQEFLGADGFAFQFGNNLHVSGRTPPKEFIHELIHWAIKDGVSLDQVQSTALHEEWEPAGNHTDTACGVLFQPIVMHRVCRLIWFRGALSRTVEWAGRPDTQKGQGTLGALSPRRSFDTWVEEHENESGPWLRAERESAGEMFKGFLDIIAAQSVLKEENTSLRQFASTAAHDLQAPLRGISMALDWMSQDDFEKGSVRETHAIAQKSSKRLAELAEGLLELTVTSEQTLETAQVNLMDVVSDVNDLLSVQMLETGTKIDLSPLPVIMANQRLILRLFLNLVSNAVKYRDPERSPCVAISAVSPSANEVEIAIVDNGVGIAPEHAERIFQPMERLQSKDEIEGTGLGLAICRRITELHGGEIRLDPRYETGARFLITLPTRLRAVG